MSKSLPWINKASALWPAKIAATRASWYPKLGAVPFSKYHFSRAAFRIGSFWCQAIVSCEISRVRSRPTVNSATSMILDLAVLPGAHTPIPYPILVTWELTPRPSVSMSNVAIATTRPALAFSNTLRSNALLLISSRSWEDPHHWE